MVKSAYPMPLVVLELLAAALSVGCNDARREARPDASVTPGPAGTTTAQRHPGEAGRAAPRTPETEVSRKMDRPASPARVRVTVPSGAITVGEGELEGERQPDREPEGSASPESGHSHGAAVPPALDRPVAAGLVGWTCNEDRAFRPSAPLTFSESGAPLLTAGLNEVSRRSAPISLVLQHRAGELVGALSATRHGAGGKEMFLPGKAPSFSRLVPAFGDQPSITSEAPQERAFLHLFDKRGPVVLELRRLLWRSSPGASCDQMLVDVHALVPFAQYGVLLHLAGGDKTIAELAGVDVPPGGLVESGRPVTVDAPGAQPLPMAVHFTFTATSAAFDASSSGDQR